MVKNLLQQSLIDRHIQADILKRLSLSDHPPKFSKLKPDGIENSLFM